MNGDTFRFIYALVLLILTVAWAAFCVWMTYKATIDLEPAQIVVAAGASSLLGALCVWDALVVKYYFEARKAARKV